MQHRARLLAGGAVLGEQVVKPQALFRQLQGGLHGDGDEVVELPLGEAFIAGKNARGHQLRSGIVDDVEKYLQGRVFHVQAPQVGSDGEQGHGPDFQLGGEQQAKCLLDQAAVQYPFLGADFAKVQVLAMFADIAFDSGGLEPALQQGAVRSDG